MPTTRSLSTIIYNIASFYSYASFILAEDVPEKFVISSVGQDLEKTGVRKIYLTILAKPH